MIYIVLDSIGWVPIFGDRDSREDGGNDCCDREADVDGVDHLLEPVSITWMFLFRSPLVLHVQHWT